MLLLFYEFLGSWKSFLGDDLETERRDLFISAAQDDSVAGRMTSFVSSVIKSGREPRISQAGLTRHLIGRFLRMSFRRQISALQPIGSMKYVGLNLRVPKFTLM